MITQSLKHNVKMLFLTLRKDQDVVNENHNKLVQLFHKNRVHQVHEVSGCVGQTKRHHQILIKIVSGGENNLCDIFSTDLDLMIARTKVNLRKRLMLQSIDRTRDQCGAMNTCSSRLLCRVIDNRCTTTGSCHSSTQR
jgi:hypothetical protein